ncbi:hypothetical protein HY358_01315 [Candidatus Roizmanbacteria bacterium]|nr:hypothetical protein [Candidatus Roizmanbacteria bacterium]
MREEHLFFNLHGMREPEFCFPNLGLYIELGTAPMEEMIITPREMTVQLGLIGKRLVLTAENRFDEAQTLQRIQFANQYLRDYNGITGLDLSLIPDPLFVYFDMQRGTLNVQKTIKRYAQRNAKEYEYDPMLLKLATRLNTIDMNQFGTYIAGLFATIKKTFPRIDLDKEAYEKSAAAVGIFFDKVAYVELVNEFLSTNSSDEIPIHATTFLVSPNQLSSMNSFQEVQKLFAFMDKEPKQIFVKANIGSGGDWQMILSESTTWEKFHQFLASLPKALTLLIQEAVEPTTSKDGKPNRIGVNLFIDTEGIPYILGATTQIYKDRERTKYFGSVWNVAMETTIVQSIEQERLLQLASLFAARGYRGPFNLDFVQDKQGQYVSIYDMNPRVTGALPIYTGRLFLERAGLSVKSLINFSSGGKVSFPDYRQTLQKLNEVDILCTASRQNGAVIIPNVYQPDQSAKQLNCDVLVANITDPYEIQRILEIIRSISESNTLPETIYW